MGEIAVEKERFEDYVRHHAREHELIQLAAGEAKTANEYRLNGLNELRKEVERDRDMYALRSESKLVYSNIEERLRKVENTQHERQSSTVTWIIAMGIIFSLIQIGLKFIGVGV